MAVTPRLYSETVTIVRPGAPVSDGQGGWRDGPAVEVEVDATVQPLTVRDALIARQEGATVTHTMFAPWGTDVRRGDTMVAPDRGFEAEVVGIRRSAKPGHHLRVSLEERQPGSVTLLGSPGSGQESS